MAGDNAGSFVMEEGAGNFVGMGDQAWSDRNLPHDWSIRMACDIVNKLVRSAAVDVIDVDSVAV